MDTWLSSLRCKICFQESLWEIALFAASCAVLWGLLGLQCQAFTILLLGISSWIGGLIFGFIALPPLIGMLLVGILFRNVPVISMYVGCISLQWTSVIREMSLIIILLRAGLGLDPKHLKSLKGGVSRLALLPCLAEAVVAAVAAKYLLSMPWGWAFAFGFCETAASAAVLVPGILLAEERGLGQQSGACTLVLAALSVDNVLALIGFTITFGVMTSGSGNLELLILKRVIEPVAGFAIGIVIGLLLWYIPKNQSGKVCSALWLTGWGLTTATRRADLPGVGALGCVALSFIASVRWRKSMPKTFQTLSSATSSVWKILEPFLFALIGAEVELQSLFKNNIEFVLLTLVIGLVARTIVTYLVLLPTSSLVPSERLYLTVSWISKATVQAAVGSQVLDYAKSHIEDAQLMVYGEKILDVSILCIVLTAPLGAVFMDKMAPRMLRAQDENAEESRKCIERISDDHIANYGSCSLSENKPIEHS